MTSILVLVRPDLYTSLFTPPTDRTLRAFGDATFVEREVSSVELAALIPGIDIVVTGWGSPRFTDEVLHAAEDVKLIAHSAGSIKAMLPPAVFEKGIAVTHASSALALPVAEMTLLLILMALRQVHKIDHDFRTGSLSWAEASSRAIGEDLTHQRVGVVGVGYIGRLVIPRLQAMEAEVWVYDPYLTSERAQEMGVRKATLDDLLTHCRIVTLHAPTTPETRHMIGKRELSLLQDGAILINTARSWLTNEAALLDELRTGRIQAALDVFDIEPLPDDSPFRTLGNVILTPHMAALTTQARANLGQTVVDEIGRFLAGIPLRFQVTRNMLDIMA